MLLSKTKGFTLLELLVVIVLLGIVSSFAMLSLNLTGLESELDEEARKIHALIKLAKEEAIIQAQEIALAVDKKSYVFKYLGSQGQGNKKKYLFLPKESKVFRERVLHEGMKMHLETEQKFVFKQDEKDRKFDSTMFSSSGEQSAFTLTISLEEDTQIYYEIIGKINGDVSIKKSTNFEY